jgi:putative tricarboxylic transport membrane protein
LINPNLFPGDAAGNFPAASLHSRIIPMWKKDYIGGAVFIVLGVLIWVFTFQFPVLPGGHPGPSLFPRVLGTLFIFFSLIVILEGWRKSKRPPPPTSIETAEELREGNVIIIAEKNHFNSVLVIILIAAFIVAAPYLGFIITGGAVLFTLMWKLHVKPIKGFIISVLVICSIYSVFAKILRVPLPQGFLWW